jgi:hypothetical protein
MPRELFEKCCFIAVPAGRLPGYRRWRTFVRRRHPHFVPENMALSAVSAVVSSSWLLRAAAFQKAPFKMTFAGSNPPCPVSQCGLSYAISGDVGTGDIPAGYAGAPESLAGKFRTFGSGLVASRRQSLLAVFQFPFWHARDRVELRRLDNGCVLHPFLVHDGRP